MTTPIPTGNLESIDDAFARAAKSHYECAARSTGFEYGITRHYYLSVLSRLDWTGFGSIGPKESSNEPTTASLRAVATQIALRESSVAVPRIQPPALSGNLVSDVQAICGLTFREIADLYGISERAVAEWKSSGVPRHRTELLEALRSIGMILFGGLGADGVARWFSTGTPSRLEQLREGEITKVAERARSYLDTPAS